MTMDLFPLKVVLTFIVGTLWIAGAALLAEDSGTQQRFGAMPGNNHLRIIRNTSEKFESFFSCEECILQRDFP